jgi:hypothetical protein
MADRFRVSRTLPARLEELGLSPAVVLQQVGLLAGLFDQEKILVTTEELFALYRGIAEASDNPAIGLHWRLRSASSATIRSKSPRSPRGRSATRWSAWRATSSSLVPRRSIWPNAVTNARCASNGCWPTKKNPRC